MTSPTQRPPVNSAALSYLKYNQRLSIITPAYNRDTKNGVSRTLEGWKVSNSYWRALGTRIRLDLYQAIFTLSDEKPRDQIKNQIFDEVARHISSVFLTEDSKAALLDDPDTPRNEQFMTKISQRAGRHIGARALTALGLCREAANGEVLGHEEQAELLSFLHLFHDTLREHMVSRPDPES